jgi:hypothetical protein
MEIKELFEIYIFDWMCRDIEREIEWAKNDQDAGNALCALGLLAYTEFMGKLLLAFNSVHVKNDSEYFDAFLRYMGPEYTQLIDKKKVNVYKIFRCGLAHEYFIKRDCKIAMLNSTPGRLKIAEPSSSTNPLSTKRKLSYVNKPAKCGLGIANNGGYWFIVEKYYEDFRKACERIYRELQVPKPNLVTYKVYPTMSSSD